MRLTLGCLILAGGLLASCRDASHDIPCLVPLPKDVLNARPQVLLNGVEIGRLADGKLLGDSLLLSTIEMQDEIRLPKGIVFHLRLMSLLGLNGPYAIQATVPGSLKPPYLTTRDTVRVQPYAEPAPLLDSTAGQLLDSLIRHVGRRARTCYLSPGR